MTRPVSTSGNHSLPLAQRLADLRLAREIRLALQALGRNTLRRCEIAVRADVAVLRGRVPSFHLKQLAQEFVLRVDGVARVANELRVTRPPS